MVVSRTTRERACIGRVLASRAAYEACGKVVALVGTLLEVVHLIGLVNVSFFDIRPRSALDDRLENLALFVSHFNDHAIGRDAIMPEHLLSDALHGPPSVGQGGGRPLFLGGLHAARLPEGALEFPFRRRWPL